MGWFDQTREVSRLTTENQELCLALENSEQRLFAEIDANRAREAALMDQIVALAGIQPQTPLHEPLAGGRKAADDGLDDEPVDVEFERQVSERAADYAKAALENGIEYDAVTLDLLKDKIRQNPAEYLGN